MHGGWACIAIYKIRSLHGYEPEIVNGTLGMQTTYDPLTCLKLSDLGIPLLCVMWYLLQLQ